MRPTVSEILKDLVGAISCLLGSLFVVSIIVLMGAGAHHTWKLYLPWGQTLGGLFVSTLVFGVVPFLALLAFFFSRSTRRLFSELRRVSPENMPKSFNPMSPWVLFSYSRVILFLEGLHLEDHRSLSLKVKKEFKKWSFIETVVLMPLGLLMMEPTTGMLVIGVAIMISMRLLDQGLPGIRALLTAYL